MSDRGFGKEMGRKAAGGAVSGLTKFLVGLLLAGVVGGGIWGISEASDDDDDDRRTSVVQDDD